jgi:hypothetical protein
MFRRSPVRTAAILDTRKTIPGLRSAQKYAVRCGGGQNHRIGLYDLVLIKENHIAAAGSISAAVSAARSHAPALRVEVETENRSTQVREALAARADIVMLDNFDLDAMRTAVALNRSHPNRALLESSGGVTLATLRTRLRRPAWTTFRSVRSPRTSRPSTCRFGSICLEGSAVTLYRWLCIAVYSVLTLSIAHRCRSCSRRTSLADALLLRRLLLATHC